MEAPLKSSQDNNLSSETYWDSLYSNKHKHSFSKKLLHHWQHYIDNLRITGKYQDPLEEILWNHLIKKILPISTNTKAIEIGSAPGHFLVRLNKELHYQSYGIEYTPSGVSRNRELFIRYGLSPENILHLDFIKELPLNLNLSFDVVISQGFIEHFDNPKTIIDKHLALLSPGGYLIVSIPNLQGLNYKLANFLNPETLRTHNLTIMNKAAFSSLFERDNLKEIYCDYFGNFTLALFNAPPKSLKSALLGLGKMAQPLLNFAQKCIFRKDGLKHLDPRTSPMLIYIGRKTNG